MTPSDNSPAPEPSRSLQRRRVGIMLILAVSAGTGLAWYLELAGLRTFSSSLEARTTVVTANRAARVQEVSIKTGQTVAPGDPLFQLIDGPLADQLESKRRELVEGDVELGRTKAAADVELAWRRRDLQAEIFETQLKIATLSQEKLNKQVEQIAWKDHLTSVESNLEPSNNEEDNPFRSISMTLRLPDERRLQAMLREDAAAAAVEAIATQVALCEQRLKKLETLDKEIESKIRASSGVDLAEARIANIKQQLLVLEGEIKELAITSPTYGTIGEVKLQSGDRVSAGGMLVEILDNDQRHVVAQIPSSAASKLKTGSTVTLVFPPEQRRIGIIASIPPQATAATAAAESCLAVKIEPAGKLWPKFAIGSSVKVLLP